MKSISSGMQACVNLSATTLCWCWKLTRKDGAIFGFTDHDVNVVVDSIVYCAASCVDVSEFDTQKKFGDAHTNIAGALSSDALNEADIAAGIFDAATVELYRVNWSNPTQYLLMRKGVFGTISRGPVAFETELRDLSVSLSQPVGRNYCYLCDAAVGDSRCMVDTAIDKYSTTGAILETFDNRRFIVSGLSGYETEWFAGGALKWSSKAYASQVFSIKRHTATSSQVTIELWLSPGWNVSAGDAFSITAGCDKTFATCKSKFSNGINYQGFPYMVGNDAVITYAYGDIDLDGGSRYGN